MIIKTSDNKLTIRDSDWLGIISVLDDIFDGQIYEARNHNWLDECAWCSIEHTWCIMPVHVESGVICAPIQELTHIVLAFESLNLSGSPLIIECNNRLGIGVSCKDSVLFDPRLYFTRWLNVSHDRIWWPVDDVENQCWFYWPIPYPDM